MLQRFFGGKILTFAPQHATVYEDQEGNRYDFTSDQYGIHITPPEVVPFKYRYSRWQYPIPKKRDKLLEAFVRERVK